MGETPKIISRKKLDNFRTKYIFDNSCVGLSKFEDKREEIEASFRRNIESIKYGKHKGRVEITFNTQDFPKKLTYSEVSKSTLLPPESFFIGYSQKGVLTQRIAELPHLLIAGTTGSGKSVCLKQILMGLLESSPHIQMYLVDLKGGLEMIDFAGAMNVQVVKTMDDTLELFGRVQKEMDLRFKYLEKHGKKNLIPSIDQKDRIVLVVDEASVLYMSRDPHDLDRENALKARGLADSIAKLSRAAAIHLILATQKVENKVIPTSVTENISGRMIFRVNSFQGSNQVIGSKDAMMLPEIPGRGIWNFGIQKVTVQAPFIDEKTIKERCQIITDELKTKKRKCFGLTIQEIEKREEDASETAFDSLDLGKKMPSKSTNQEKDVGKDEPED